MFNFVQESPKDQGNFNQQNCFASDFSLSLITLPFLISIGMFNQLEDNLIEWGKMSEEIFRGNRLPLLSIDD